MTLRLIEGFDYLPETPTGAVLGALGWSGSLSRVRFVESTAFGYGKSMVWRASSGIFTVSKFLRGKWTQDYIIGMRLNLPTRGFNDDGGLNQPYSLVAYDNTASRLTQWMLNFDQFGTMSFVAYLNGTRSVFARTVPFAFVPGNWFYLEIKISPGYGDGTLELRVNTVPVLSLSNVRTADGTPILPETLPGITHLAWVYNTISTSGANSEDWYTDDVYFLTMDGDNNNDYLGNVRVKYMSVIGDASPIEWSIGGTTPAPTNWQSVLNIDLNDTSYVSTSTIGDTDLYDVDPNLDTPYVYGVELAGAYRQDDATQRFVRNVLKSGSTIIEGAENATNQTYVYFYDIFELNPETGVPFTGAELNSVDIGPRLTG